MERRTFIKAVAFGFVAVPPLLRPENTARVVRALFTNKVDCSTDSESKNNEYLYDAIVVPGAGADLKSEVYAPNESGRIRLRAAAYAYYRGAAPIVVLLDGASNPLIHEAYREHLQMAYEELSGKGNRIPEESIIVDGISINTATNMEELQEIANEKNFRKVLIASNYDHMPRATLLACARGIAAAGSSAEDIIAVKEGRDPEFKGPPILSKETAEILLIAYDPLGKIPTFAKKIVNLVN